MPTPTIGTTAEQQILIDWLKNSDAEAAITYLSEIAYLDFEIIKKYYQKENATSWDVSWLYWSNRNGHFNETQ